MTRIAIGAAMLLSTLATAAHAQPADADPDDTAALADQAGVDPQDLKGALNSLHTAGINVSAREYLGLLESPGSVVSGGRVPAPAGSDSRVACIEAKESGGANVANRRGSGAVGVMQFMPGTFYAHAAEMGHFDWSPWTPWQARAVAAHDLALGRRAQWTVSGC